MTELIIDGVSAVLSKDFSIQVKRENPLFTKNGEYTYDITLPLDNPTNAELYKHLNRLNSTQPVSTDRRAVLVADNRVYCNGTEVITGWTEDTVSVQIASGNSELNYIIGDDLLISSLINMPETSHTLDKDTQDQAIADVYPDMDFCISTVKDSTTDILYNYMQVTYDEDSDSLVTSVSDYLPQPYLCAYIRELLKALGYTLVLNQLENTAYKMLFICNVYSFKWNEILPGWKVMDFLEQIEKMFNASFVIDNRKKTAQLLLNNNYFTGQKSVHISEVIDTFEAEIEESNDLIDYDNTRIAYNVPDNDYWRLNVLPDGYLEQADIVAIPEDYKPGINDSMRVIYYIDEFAPEDYKTLYHTGDPDEGLYLHIYQPSGETVITKYICLLNRFAPINPESEEELSLQIVPAQLTHYSFHDVGVPTPEGESQVPYSTFIPIVQSASSNDDPNAGNEGIDQILNWTDTGEATADNICVAFYTGGEDHTLEANGKVYVFKGISTHTDKYDYAGIPTYKIGFTLIPNSTLDGCSLRPLDLKKNFYEGTYDIEYDKAIKTQSFDPNIYDPSRIFEIRNRRYVCKEMEYTLDAHGRKGAWTGTFYPIHISDTEADARWILTDGKWRDGGVWLDNGRWLDE